MNECTGCHQPLRGNDYVYTTPISTAKVSGVEVVNNAAATLPATLPFQPLGWRAITMYVDPAAHATAALYGNDAAMQAVQALRAVAAGAPAYKPGAVLALVTWAQREDPHWFGARIPDRPLSVEFVQAGGSEPTYRRFAGPDLTSEQNAAAAQRTSFILGLLPAWLP